MKVGHTPIEIRYLRQYLLFAGRVARRSSDPEIWVAECLSCYPSWQWKASAEVARALFRDSGPSQQVSELRHRKGWKRRTRYEDALVEHLGNFWRELAAQQ